MEELNVSLGVVVISLVGELNDRLLGLSLVVVVVAVVSRVGESDDKDLDVSPTVVVVVQSERLVRMMKNSTSRWLRSWTTNCWSSR